MKFTMTGRHVELTKSIKDYTKKKFSKVEEFFDFKNAGEMHIIITVEKHGHLAEANLNSKKHSFSAKVETKDMYSSIDMLETKLVNQIKKHKDKLQKPEKKNKRINMLASVTDASSAKGEKFNEVIEEELQALKPMNTEEAIEELQMLKENMLLFYNVDFNKVCLVRKRKDKKFGLTISKY